MKPGEFKGKDGKTYRWHDKWFNDRWTIDGVDYRGELEHVGISGLAKEDWPAAKAALDALIESERETGEWMEWEVGAYRYRAKRDGSVVQWEAASNRWDNVSVFERVAYRKGREVALKEFEQRLACAYADSSRGAQGVLAQLCDEYLDKSGAMLGRIRDLAKEVKL